VLSKQLIEKTIKIRPGSILSVMTLLAFLALAVLVGGCRDPRVRVSLKVTHRLFPNFEEIHEVHLGERFGVGDQDFAAEATEFVPDFAIGLESGKIFSRSDEPNNPAVKVLVFQGDEQVDKVWAFTGEGAPHFARTSFLAFQLLSFSGWRGGTVTVPGTQELEPDEGEKEEEREKLEPEPEDRQMDGEGREPKQLNGEEQQPEQDGQQGVEQR
jgi:hypothetical protein